MNEHPVFWGEFALVAGGVALFLALLFLPMFVSWRKMARLYPDGPFVAERVYYSVLGGLGGRGISHHMALGKQGLRLFAIAPLRRVLPSILIPWDAIYVLQGKPSTLGSDSLIMEISRLSSAWRFWFLWRHGNVISVIQQCWEKHRAGADQIGSLQSKSGPIVLNRS